jgi:hypothetical protein
MNYKVVPIHAEIAKTVRANMISPQYKHPASVAVATGYGPCRQCLKKLVVGEDERILFTYNAFENLSNLPLPGPVFIHEKECESFDENGFPPELIDLPLLFESYGCESALVKREPAKKENIETQIAEMLALPGANYIHIRNAEAGCFIARIERA